MSEVELEGGDISAHEATEKLRDGANQCRGSQLQYMLPSRYGSALITKYMRGSVKGLREELKQIPGSLKIGVKKKLENQGRNNFLFPFFVSVLVFFRFCIVFLLCAA